MPTLYCIQKTYKRITTWREVELKEFSAICPLRSTTMTTSDQSPNPPEARKLEISQVGKAVNADLAPICKEDFRVQFLDALRLPFLFLSIGGIQLPETVSVEPRTRKNPTCLKVRKYLFQVYRLIILIWHLISFLRIIITCMRCKSRFVDLDGAILIGQFVNTIFGTIVYVTVQIDFYCHFVSFVEVLLNYGQDFGFLQDLSKRQRLAKIILVFFLFNVTACMIGYSFPFTNVCAPLINLIWNIGDNDTKLGFFMRFLFQIENFLNMCPMIGVFVVYTLILSIICAEFHHTAAVLQESLKTVDDTAEVQFHNLRERYQRLCRTVVAFNKLTCAVVAESMIFAVALIYIIVYGLSHSEMTLSEKYIYPIIVSINLLIIIILLTVVWGQLPVAASSVVDKLADVSWRAFPDHLMNKVGVFISQCFNQKVGVHVFGMFMINNNTALVMTSTILTYGIVLIQFSDDKKALTCHCSGNNSTS